MLLPKAIHDGLEHGSHVTSDQFRAGLADVRTELASLETRLIRRMVGTIIVTATLTVSILHLPWMTTSKSPTAAAIRSSIRRALRSDASRPAPITDPQAAVNEAIAALDRLEPTVKVRSGDGPRAARPHSRREGRGPGSCGPHHVAIAIERGSGLGRSLGQIVTILDEPLAKARPVAFVTLTENIS